MVVLGFPAVFKFFENTTAAFGEAGVAKFTVLVNQYQATGGIDYTLNAVGGLTGDSLIALAVVVGASAASSCLNTAYSPGVQAPTPFAFFRP